jgi:hypothetical protein
MAMDRSPMAPQSSKGLTLLPTPAMLLGEEMEVEDGIYEANTERRLCFLMKNQVLWVCPNHHKS